MQEDKNRRIVMKLRLIFYLAKRRERPGIALGICKSSWFNKRGRGWSPVFSRKISEGGNLNLFGPTEKAIFIKRPNRFVVICSLNGKPIQAFLPNPGRLWELLLPGVVLYL
jgi:hypothetical protein